MTTRLATIYSASSTPKHHPHPAPHPTRLPGSVSSLKVQLSASELLRQRQQPLRSTTSTPDFSSQPSNYSFVSLSQLRQQQQQQATHLAFSLNANIQPTDVQLLATSILGNQARQCQMLTWSETLINLPSRPRSSHHGTGREVSRETLKRALTFLSPSSWLAVLDERFLAGSCPYPSCNNSAPTPSRTTEQSRPPQYRISLRSKTVSRNTAQDPGDRETFCSQHCFQRAEWVRQWVLKDRDDIKPPAPGQDAHQGGRFERLMDQDAWRQVELLEDLQESGEVERLLTQPAPQVETPTAKPATSNAAPSSAIPRPLSPPLSSESRATASTDPRKPAKDQVAALLDSLTIYERTPNVPSPSPAPAPITSRVDYDVDLPSHIGARFTGAASTPHHKRNDTEAHTGKDNNEHQDDDADLVLGLTSPSRNMHTKRSVSAILITSARGLSQRPETQASTEEGQDEMEEEQGDPKVVEEQRKLHSWMHDALKVRDEQRQLGLLD